MMEAGLINDTEVYGNSQADVLAKRGVSIYAIDDHVLDPIQRRTDITMLIQNMMVMFWTKERQLEKDTEDARALALVAEDIPGELNLSNQ